MSSIKSLTSSMFTSIEDVVTYFITLKYSISYMFVNYTIQILFSSLWTHRHTAYVLHDFAQSFHAALCSLIMLDMMLYILSKK